MKKRSLFILCFIIGLGNIAFAQVRTVTNTDLEKFKQQRLQGEKDLRENYEKLGFPSPAELAKRREQKRAEFERVSDELREQRLQRELLEAERVNYFRVQSDFGNAFDNNPTYSNGIYGFGYPVSGYLNYGYQNYLPYRPGFKLRLNYGGGNWQRNNQWNGGGYNSPNSFGRPTRVNIAPTRPR